ADGSSVSTPILRRFAIQQSRIGWGASPFAAVPAREDTVVRSSAEQVALGGGSSIVFGLGECRPRAGRGPGRGRLLVHAVPQPHPERPLEALVLTPRGEPSAVYAVTLTDLAEHPLRAGVRRRVRLELPPGARLNAIGELDDVAIDLGTVISARAALDYDPERWA